MEGWLNVPMTTQYCPYYRLVMIFSTPEIKQDAPQKNYYPENFKAYIL